MLAPLDPLSTKRAPALEVIQESQSFKHSTQSQLIQNLGTTITIKLSVDMWPEDLLPKQLVGEDVKIALILYHTLTLAQIWQYVNQ